MSLRRSVLALLGISLIACAAPVARAQRTSARSRRSPAAENRFVDSLLARMTLEEKLGQLNQLSGLESTGPAGSTAGADLIRRGGVGSLFNIIGADTTRALQRMAVEQSRLHIPLVFGLDVIHGFRTTFPVPLGEAASWDPALAERTAHQAAVEAAANGIAWTFAPMVDIARDARWGRIVEGAGEDPYLGAAFAMARVRGFQGADLRANDAIAATAKHFAAYGAAEAGRDYNIANIPERTLRDVYLPPFHAAVCAGTQTLMASFNDIDGMPSHANRHLLTDILRSEWKFDGMVVSDWTGILELIQHGVAADRAAAGELAIRAGVDMDMVSAIYARDLPALVRSGRVPQREVDDAVRRVLRLKYRLGLFEDPYHGADAARARRVTLTAESRALAREAARESIVLLENRGVLPLRKNGGTVAVLGELAADSAAPIGSWGGQGRTEDVVTILDGIRRAVAAGTSVVYERGAAPTSDDTSGIAAAVQAVRGASVAIVVVGEAANMSGEASSRAFLTIPGAQLRLVAAVQATGVPTVVVLMNGRPLSLGWLHDHVPAVVETWFGGTEAGNATADVLFGDYDPSGRLPTTFPRAVGQEPLYYAHKNTGRPAADSNHYSSKYLDVPWTPLYPFGYGLSYTTFGIGAPRLSATVLRPGGSLGVDVPVRNTGGVPGVAVVQLYVRDDVGSVTRPVEELRGFRRVPLAPGESRTVHFSLGEQALAFHDSAMQRVVEPGSFTVYAGSDAEHTSAAHFRFETPGGRSVRVPETCAAFQGDAGRE